MEQVTQEQAIGFCNEAFRNMDVEIFGDDMVDITAALSDFLTKHTRTTDQAKDEEIARLVEELRLWRMLVNEGGVPRYTITPGAALNTIVTSTDGFLRRYPDA